MDASACAIFVQSSACGCCERGGCGRAAGTDDLCSRRDLGARERWYADLFARWAHALFLPLWYGTRLGRDPRVASHRRRMVRACCRAVLWTNPGSAARVLARRPNDRLCVAAPASRQLRRTAPVRE